MKCRTAILAAAMLPLAACGPQFKPEERAALEHEASLVITCKEGSDCERKWSRAVRWVSEHSAYSLRHSTKYLIQTFGPRPSETHPAFTVTRYASTDGSYIIDFKSLCMNWFSCDLSPAELKGSFTYFVLEGK